MYFEEYTDIHYLKGISLSPLFHGPTYRSICTATSVVHHKISSIKPIIRRRRWGWRQLPGQPNGRKRIPSHGSQNKPQLGCPQYSTSHHPLRLNGNSCSPKEAKQLRHSRAASLQHSTSSRRFYDYKTIVVTWQYLKKITLHCKNVWVTQTVVTSSSDIETSVIRFTGLTNV